MGRPKVALVAQVEAELLACADSTGQDHLIRRLVGVAADVAAVAIIVADSCRPGDATASVRVVPGACAADGDQVRAALSDTVSTPGTIARVCGGCGSHHGGHEKNFLEHVCLLRQKSLRQHDLGTLIIVSYFTKNVNLFPILLRRIAIILLRFLLAAS